MAPTIAQVRSINEASKKFALENPVAVFVGGTSGIGKHTALEFAKHAKAPTCYIVGRSEASGQAVLSALKELNADPSAKYHFIQTDCTLIKDCDKLADQIAAQEKKINLLFMSPGFLTTNGRTESKEGLDTKLAVNYYGRWRIAERLVGLVNNAAQAGESARVVSVLSPGNEGPIYEDDLDLKNKFSLSQANRHIVEFNSLAVVRFAKLYPKVGFIHAHPGIVATDIMRELPFWARAGGSLVKWLATSPEVSGEKFYYLSYASKDFATGAHLTKADLGDAMEKPLQKGYLDERLQDLVWKHTEDKFEEITGSR